MADVWLFEYGFLVTYNLSCLVNTRTCRFLTRHSLFFRSFDEDAVHDPLPSLMVYHTLAKYEPSDS
jgi:hypothetical protein